ncbi:poly [ADP-ribose] polymerase-like [Contarinia nasturtii]|uniref:poly [ADP-ribose] polymerase-like n=1 Tax=Contarinia nasturtii TaxID=265458 RepID=UPI0012D3E6C0|nr:poly [ADP-ribose] polymerase-like [Contarinia nasturtii]XP_031627878.1 poly [ADP-ribose] polymerase-like [Contarinia nasturtii]
MKKVKRNLEAGLSLDALIHTQNEEFHQLLEKIKKSNLDDFWQKEILKENDQCIPRRKVEILYHVTDVIYFGAIEPCKETNCNNGRFIFDGNSKYRCRGYISGFGRCTNTVDKPERRPVQISALIRDECAFLNVEFKVQHRAVKLPNSPCTSITKSTTKPDSASKKYFIEVEMTLKDGSIVHPRSNLQDIAHVYMENGKHHSAPLNKIDLAVQVNKNSYYILQLLESDSSNPRKYWIYRSWGRINDTSGGDDCKEYNNLEEARKKFYDTYKKKTRNDFFTPNFKKLYGKYFHCPASTKDVEDAAHRAVHEPENSALPESVQNLIKLLIDKELMSAVMVKFGLDLIKMPLGKIERNQLKNAGKMLEKIAQIIEENESPGTLIEASNKFYSLIPHKVCSSNVITCMKQLHEKADLLMNLFSIKFTYELFFKATGDKIDCLLDNWYEKLENKIEPLERNSDEFQTIIEHIDYTRGENDIKIDDIFKIQRENDDVSFEPYRRLPNRKMLWHGSRITNFNGILANGLRIAPPEALVIGCMLGKGLYFSDFFANAMHYCYTEQTNHTGIIALCEVALGESLTYYDSDRIDELPDDKHSVWGVGKISTESNKLLDGVKIAWGKPVKNKTITTSFDYNDFVVYKKEQAKVKYLVKFTLLQSMRRY